jgi:hypothetical protein
VNAPDPTREMALVGKACAHRDIGQAGSDMTNKLDRSLPSQMHDVAVRTDANESGEQPGKWNGLRPAIFERGDFDGLIDVSNHVICNSAVPYLERTKSRPAYQFAAAANTPRK